MDAQAHLMSMGWAGPGHALDHHKSELQSKASKNHRGLGYDPKSVRTNGSSNGLVKPLLISRRTDRLGIGKNVHEPAAGNEWWLAGFERALGNIGKSGSDVSGTSTPDSGSGVAKPSAYLQHDKYGGSLYGYFVKGSSIEGTIDERTGATGAERNFSIQSEAITQRPKKRKSGEISGAPQPTSKSQPQADADKNNIEYVAVEAFLKERDKDRRRRERNAKPDDTTQFAQVGKYFAAVNGRAKSRLNGESTPQDEDEHDQSTPNSTHPPPETKEERRERRRQRREARAARSALSSIDTPDMTTTSYGGTDEEATVAEAARKAERRRRKEARRLDAERRRSSPPFQVM